MMTKLKREVSTLVGKELEEANKNYPLFASDHEAIAVIFEEIQEAREELYAIDDMLEGTWTFIKQNKDPVVFISELQRHAERLAAEAIQVAAMCEKQKMSKEEPK